MNQKIIVFFCTGFLIASMVFLSGCVDQEGTKNPTNSQSVTSENKNSSINIENEFQTVNMNIDTQGYHPSTFVIKKGIPVKWKINVTELTPCNNEIIMNTYKIDVKLKQGINIIEFTPDKTETIGFSCGMGMLRGSFIVTEAETK